MRLSLTVILALLISGSVAAQNSCTESLQLPFKVGEKLSYELVYNWGFIWAKAGKVDFEVRDTIYNGKEHFHFYSYGRSYRGWDWFYKVRSSYSSIATLDMQPLEFLRDGKEGSHFYYNHYNIRDDRAHLKKMDEEGRFSYRSFDLPECAFDVITAIYYCRSLDFDEVQVGQIIPLDLFLDGDNFPSQLRYIGKKTLEDDRFDEKIDCIVFKPLLIEGTVFSEGENMTVWVRDDGSRVPVYIETDLVVGKAKVYLVE